MPVEDGDVKAPLEAPKHDSVLLLRPAAWPYVDLGERRFTVLGFMIGFRVWGLGFGVWGLG